MYFLDSLGPKRSRKSIAISLSDTKAAHDAMGSPATMVSLATTVEPEHESRTNEQLKHGDGLTIRKDGSVELTPLDYWKDSKLPTWMQTAVRDTFTFVVTHYNLWFVPFVGLFYYLIQNGFTLVVVALVAIYLPWYLDGSQCTPQGRTWDTFTRMPIWHAVAQFLNIKSIRETPLDGNKTYIFGFRPHGISVMSRITTYAGNWQKLFPKITFRGESLLFQCEKLNPCYKVAHTICSRSVRIAYVLRATRSRPLSLGGRCRRVTRHGRQSTHGGY